MFYLGYARKKVKTPISQFRLLRGQHKSVTLKNVSRVLRVEQVCSDELPTYLISIHEHSRL